VRRSETDATYDALPLTDALAAQRTVLAAERTLLSYLRSAFALVVGGVTGSVALPDTGWQVLSYGFIAGGLAVVVFGAWRYRVEFTRLERLVRKAAARRTG
jgi:putative membrane protein